VDGAQNLGNAESAGCGALVLIEELGAEISDSDLLSTLERAEVLLEDAQETSIIRRLAKCARRVASSFMPHQGTFPRRSIGRVFLTIKKWIDMGST
jgi:hypothetical protein